jgi:hypothetical protein
MENVNVQYMGNLSGILKCRAMDQTPASQNVACKRCNKESIHTNVTLNCSTREEYTLPA